MAQHDSADRDRRARPALAAQPARKLLAKFRWDDVQHFLALARCNRLLEASRTLGVAHTTVLRRVEELERRLDRKLFDRTESGFILTDAGRDFLEHAEAMERASLAMAGHAGEPERPVGTVRLATMEGLAAKFLAPRLNELQVSHPGVVVEIVTLPHIGNLSKREADISVGFVRPTGTRLIARRVGGCGVHLYAAQSYVDRHRAPRRVEDLGTHVFVDYIDDMIWLPPLRWFRDTVDQRRVIFRSSSPMAQLAAVMTGIGIGMFPDYMVEGCGLRLVLPELADRRDFWLAVHEDLRNVPRVSVVHDLIKTIFLRAAPELRFSR